MAWIITIAKNLCLQRMRERKKAECTSQEGWELAIPDTDMLTMEDRSILVTCMEQLSDEERQIVMLHAAVGFKHREIATSAVDGTFKICTSLKKAETIFAIGGGSNDK